MVVKLAKSMLLGLVENDDTPVSTRVDTDTGVGSVSDSSDMAWMGGRQKKQKKQRGSAQRRRRIKNKGKLLGHL